MSAVFDRVLTHVSKTIQAPPTGTITVFPSLSSRGFRDVDSAGGARGQLEEQVGQSRVFELDLDALDLTPSRLGGTVVKSYQMTFPVRIRYEGLGPHRKAEIQAQILEDMAGVVDAIQRSNWPSVSGLASLTAAPGSMSRFVIADDAGNSYEGYISSVVVDASIDT